MDFDVEKAIAAKLAAQTDAERAEWAKFQNEQRAKLNMGDGRVILGQRQVRLALDQLEIEGCDDDFEFERLAEGYSLQGDFLRAYVLTTNEQKKREYKAILDADETDCLCASKHKFIKDKHPDFFIQACASCGHLRKC